MGCSESKQVQARQVSSPSKKDSHTAATTDDIKVNWALYRALKQYRDNYFIGPDDVKAVTVLVSSNDMTTEVGFLNGQFVYLKSVASSADDQATARWSLMTEISSRASIHHPNIVGFKGFTIAPTKGLSCVTEYMEGGTLRSLLDDQQAFAKLTWAVEKINFAIDICTALCCLHKDNPQLIDSNIQASKVLLNRDHTCAKLSGSQTFRGRRDERLFIGYAGEFGWTAPEALLGDDVDSKGDVYSFGVLLTELDTGLLLYAGIRDTTPLPLLMNKLVSKQLRLTLSPGCPEEIAKIVNLCIGHDPHIRPSSDRVLEMLQNAKIQLNSLTKESVVEFCPP
ncbi:unnamed protein product [Aphanomyces euteiches]|uniref:Protein kinase domain-containing protein n=1 Tax=Aphanomyces euteiches TaxID=100861 RepID=A0A6G0WR83_9STRA|nr:hypothetical protein Ae201684_012566 [Aphanomyces euteiches]KAH9090464.1 hypothetical protein Ae201684P_014266 [Aphanomyces euteiches]